MIPNAWQGFDFGLGEDIDMLRETARGAILSSEKLRVVSRSMSMSSPSPKSKPCQALGIMRAPECSPAL